MTKKESYIIDFILCLSIPFLMFVFFWWTAALLHKFKILTVPESVIILSAVTGFIVGVLITVFFLKKLVASFYHIHQSILILLYLYCSALAVAFFMGLPLGNWILGMVTGFYIGRKYHHLNRNHDIFSAALKATGLLTAFVTSTEAFVIGLLALQEQSIINSINQYLRFTIFTLNPLYDILIIFFLCVILFVIQFFSTRLASNYAYNI